MKLLVVIIGLLFFVACEYNSKIVLSKKLPLILKIEDNSIIKHLSIGYAKNDVLEINLSDNTTQVSIDSIIIKNRPKSIDSLYTPNEDYSISTKTNKTTGGVIFHVDSQKNIIVTLNK